MIYISSVTLDKENEYKFFEILWEVPICHNIFINTCYFFNN
jgi:hypothetical protein